MYIKIHASSNSQTHISYALEKLIQNGYDEINFRAQKHKLNEIEKNHEESSYDKHRR